MTEKIIKDLENYKNKIDDYLSSMECQFDYARDEIQDLIDKVQISDEVSDFLQSLIDNPQIPEDIQNRAGDLWTKI